MKQQITPKTVIVVNDFAYVNGGASQVALSSAVALAEHGFSVVLFTAVLPLSDELNHPRLEVIATNQQDILTDKCRTRAVLQGLWNLRAFRKFSRLLATLEPATTVVHVHSWTKALSSSVVRCAVTRNFRVIVTLHDYFSVCPNGSFFNFQRQSICELTPLSIECIRQHCDVRSYQHKVWRLLRQFIQQKIGLLPEKIEHVIVISPLSERIMAPYLSQSHVIHRILNPIGVLQAEPVSVGVNNNFVFVGRLSPEKGPILLARAAANLKCRVTFVGDGDCRQEIQSTYPSARVTGWLAHRDVQTHLMTARALVLPSLWYETQGLVVAEAAALGVPAIVPDTCAARDMVEDGQTGLWFRSGDENDLLEKMRRLQQSDALSARLGKAAYDRFWRDPCTMEKYVSELADCYSRLLSI